MIYTKEEIVLKILEELPMAFRMNLFLAEFYGTLEFNVRQTIDSYTGWYGGEVENLRLYHNKQERVLTSLGGCETIAGQAFMALNGTVDDLNHALNIMQYCNDPK